MAAARPISVTLEQNFKFFGKDAAPGKLADTAVDARAFIAMCEQHKAEFPTDEAFINGYVRIRMMGQALAWLEGTLFVGSTADQAAVLRDWALFKKLFNRQYGIQGQHNRVEFDKMYKRLPGEHLVTFQARTARTYHQFIHSTDMRDRINVKIPAKTNGDEFDDATVAAQVVPHIDDLPAGREAAVREAVELVQQEMLAGHRADMLKFRERILSHGVPDVLMDIHGCFVGPDFVGDVQSKSRIRDEVNKGLLSIQEIFEQTAIKEEGRKGGVKSNGNGNGKNNGKNHKKKVHEVDHEEVEETGDADEEVEAAASGKKKGGQKTGKKKPQQAAGSSQKKVTVCDHCNRPGHEWKNCFKLRDLYASRKKASEVDSSSQAVNALQTDNNFEVGATQYMAGNGRGAWM